MTTDPALSIWHPFTQEALDPAPIEIVRGARASICTRATGAKLLDAISSWWVNIHGHGHPAIAAAIAEQARKLEHVIFAGFTHRPAEELAQRLRGVLPKSLEHIFFSDDGSTAVEVALKMALQYWQNIGRAREKTDRRAGTRLPRRHGRRDVGGSRFVVRRGVQRDAISRAARAFGILLPLPGGKSPGDLRHRLRGAAGAAAGRAPRRDRRADRRAAAARRRRNDRPPGGISCSASGNCARSTTCCSLPMKC